jgi:iron donor protein CyaY
MTDQEFQQRAEAALESLFDRLAGAADQHDFDVDQNSGALTVEFEEPRERYIVSPNSPVRQIWVSAQVQSFKLDWNDAAAAFVLPNTGQTLEQLLASLIRKRIPDLAL